VGSLGGRLSVVILHVGVMNKAPGGFLRSLEAIDVLEGVWELPAQRDIPAARSGSIVPQRHLRPSPTRARKSSMGCRIYPDGGQHSWRRATAVVEGIRACIQIGK